MHGRLEVVTGPMFAGKTECLIERLRTARLKGHTVQAFKPKIDGRYSSEAIVSHSGERFEAVPTDVRGLTEAEANTIGIDEVQFFGDGVVEAIVARVKAGSYVVVSGLDLNCWGEPFGPMAAILCLADDVVKLHSKCAKCRSDATRSQRTVRSSTEIMVGGAESYEPRCLGCFDPNEGR